MTSWQMYWLTRLDGIHNALEVVCVLSIVLSGIGLILYILTKCIGSQEDQEDAAACAKTLARPLIIMGIVVFISVVAFISIPTTKQMAAIVVVPKIVNSESAKEIPQNLLELCNEWVKDKTEKLKGDTNVGITGD